MKTVEIGAFEAKTHLSELLEKVRQGKTFFIAKRGHPVAELRPVSVPGRRPRFACDRDRLNIREDCDPRHEQRSTGASLSHEPPRSTRSVPVRGPVGSSALASGRPYQSS